MTSWEQDKIFHEQCGQKVDQYLNEQSQWFIQHAIFLYKIGSVGSVILGT